MVSIFIGMAKMDDRERRLAKRSDRQCPCCLDTKTCRNFLAGRQRFTHICLDRFRLGLFNRTTEFPRFLAFYTSFQRLSCRKASSSRRFGRLPEDRAERELPQWPCPASSVFEMKVARLGSCFRHSKSTFRWTRDGRVRVSFEAVVDQPGSDKPGHRDFSQRHERHAARSGQDLAK